MVNYYKVLVGSAQYHGSEALTYSSEKKLEHYSVVKVPLQRQSVYGIIVADAGKPKFATKPISETFSLPPLPSQLVRIIDWIRLYYPAPLGVTAQQILPNTLTAKLSGEVQGIVKSVPASLDNLPDLTAEQRTTLEAMQDTNTYLLHGDTGTGKTRVYVELAHKVIAAGRSVIVLTPEIGLTSQLAKSFRDIFGNRVIVVHSQLTPKARQTSWLQILKSTQPVIVLGPRSALFSPVHNLGLIVVDESHEPAYKQEQAPHYHAVRVASQLAHLHRATLVLGSATPPINDYYIAQAKHKPILRMTQLATGSAGLFSESRRLLVPRGERSSPVERTREAENPQPAPSTTVITAVVDLKDRTNFTRSQYISNALLKAIDHSLSCGEQSLLYLNRRGTARVILCANCGWQAVCPHCDLPLTYHHDLHILQCHTCGFKQNTPTSCPDCGNTEIVFKVVGTKAIEDEVKRLYPNARVMRFDTDNKKAERFEQHYEAVKSGEIDILVGTQLLAKGLDLPKLSTLGVIIADTSLTFPDYSAEERTYQLLQQVIGRVGRGHGTQEKVIVQSYAPDRPVITAALARDWDTFYRAELRERELFFFPPFCYVLKLTCRRATSKSAEKAAEQFMSQLKALKLPIRIDGPSPSFHTKAAGKYEWQLIIKSKQRTALISVINALPKSGWAYDIDPINLL